MSKKLSVEEYAEMRSEDPSQLIGMDISPSSPWKTPIKIDPDVAGKNDNDAADELQNLSISDYKKLQAKITQLELENKPDREGANCLTCYGCDDGCVGVW